MESLTFDRLADFDHEEDMRRFERIYVDNFPPYDRKPFATFARLQDHLTVYVARQDARLIGFGVMLPLPNTPAHYMSYLAVDRPHQGRGVGEQFFRHIVRDLAATTQSQALVWEVDVPHAANVDSLRRVRFYERQGAELIPFVTGYVMPTGPDTTIPMRLMWSPVRDITPPARVLQARAWIEGIYTAVYGHWRHLLPPILRGLPEAYGENT